MLSISLHIRCALQITEDSKGFWGAVHFGHLILIKVSFYDLCTGGARSAPFTRQTGGLARSTPTAAEGDWCAALLEWRDGARRTIFSFQKNRNPSSQWTRANDDDLFRWFQVSLIFYMRQLKQMLRIIGFGGCQTWPAWQQCWGLLVISRLEVLVLRCKRITCKQCTSKTCRLPTYGLTSSPKTL